MILLNKITLGLICLAGLTMMSACSAQDDILKDVTSEVESNEAHTCDFVFNVAKTGYDDEPDTRSASGWVAGDKIFLTFTTSFGTIYGDAVFKNGNWTVNYYGSFTNGATGKCSVVYFENADYESGSIVNITENTGIYEDTNGTYTYTGDGLSVSASLKPKTGRVRFAGKVGEQLTLYGISHYTSYDYSKGKFVSSSVKLTTKVTSSYTPYIYGECADTQSRLVNVITSESGFTKSFSNSIYNAGQSGYLTIPTISNYSGWQNNLTMKVNGVKFVMIPVQYSGGNFFLAETETTEELYSAIIGTTSSTPKKPARGYSFNTWLTFLSTLSDITGMKFRMPTADEWEFAAKGGNKSRGYTYSGSDVLSIVGWFSGNSGRVVQDVKQLAPNELGFYDMSGNLAEATSSKDESYTTYYKFFGGDYDDSLGSCTVTSFTEVYPTASSNYNGLRIAMSNN